MANDPLAPYRRNAGAASNTRPPVDDAEEYFAFGTRDNSPRLRIRSASGAVHSPSYNILLNVVYDRQATNIVLVYSVLVAEVRGRNLQKLIFAVENHKADFIEEFDPTRWEKPKDENQAFIDFIEILPVEAKSADTGTKH